MPCLLHLSVAIVFVSLFAGACTAFVLGPSASGGSLLLQPQYQQSLGSKSHQVQEVQMSSSNATSDDSITILGLGSLLSERSSRLTFPNLVNFRLGRVPNHRRVFMHPAAIFFERGIANMDTLEISSLSCEKCDGASFICSVFEVPKDEILKKSDVDVDGKRTIIPSQAYLEREEEFDIVQVPYLEVDSDKPRTGILCRRWTDDLYARRWGANRISEKYGPHGITSIWDQWTKPDSGILPCAAYLRHCFLAAEKMGPICLSSFLDETYLADRKTTIRQYLGENPEVLKTVPPGELAVRYGG